MSSCAEWHEIYQAWDLSYVWRFIIHIFVCDNTRKEILILNGSKHVKGVWWQQWLAHVSYRYTVAFPTIAQGCRDILQNEVATSCVPKILNVKLIKCTLAYQGIGSMGVFYGK